MSAPRPDPVDLRAADHDPPSHRGPATLAGPPTHVVSEHGAPFWVLFGLGWAVMVFGVWGLQKDGSPAIFVPLLQWLARTLLAHDGILAPAVTVGGLVLGRVLPAPVRGPVRGGLALTGIVVLFSVPLLRGYGRHEANVSILPLDYPQTVVSVVVVIWLGVAVALGRTFVRSRRAGPRNRPVASGPAGRRPPVGVDGERDAP